MSDGRIREGGMNQGGIHEGQLQVVHETRYRYTERVDVAHHLAYLSPRTTPRQQVVATELAIEPRPSQRSSGQDCFGNIRTLFALYAPHDALRVVARSRVRVLAPPLLDPRASAPWRDVRRALQYASGRPFTAASEFAFESPFVPRDDVLREYAAESFADRTTLAAGALDLMARIHADFRYLPHATEVSTPVLEAFHLRHGVCQDFAHVMIGALRSLGLAARYVSGYLLTRAPDDGPRLVGVDASHAWVSVYCPQLGWIDLDPTNDVPAGTGHVTLAFGRDYGDITPLSGVIRGGGAHTLAVAVSVAADGEPDPSWAAALPPGLSSAAATTAGAAPGVGDGAGERRL